VRHPSGRPQQPPGTSAAETGSPTSCSAGRRGPLQPRAGEAFVPGNERPGREAVAGWGSGVPARSVEHLSKRFGDRIAFEDVSFEMGHGEVFASLGPSGAGDGDGSEAAASYDPALAPIGSGEEPRRSRRGVKEDAVPTATDRDFLDMPVSDVRRVTHSGRDHHVVLLREPESGRRLPIWIGREHALELALRLLGHAADLARPLGSDLSARLVQALGGSLREVRIDRLTQGTYYAVIVVEGPHGAAEVDARPSDALALALVVGAPIRADRAVVETTESDETVAAALVAIDSQDAAGAQALLDEMTEEAEGQER
jgi:bifunctional DNase/RNase